MIAINIVDTVRTTTRRPSPFSPNHKLLLATVASAAVIAAVALLLFAHRRAAATVPRSPPNAVQAVVQGLANNQPEVLWKALPPSYQADVRDVIGAFCANMDPDLYDRAFRVLNKAVKVLNEKENYFSRSPVALSIPMLESSVGKHWRHDIGLLGAFAASDLSSLARLRQMDPGDFLASTGHQLMAGAEQLRLRTQFSPGKGPWEKMRQSLKQGQIEFVSTTNGQGYLKFISATNGASKDVAMTQVEGRWVPAELAATWKSRIAQAKEGMAKLNGPELGRVKPILTMVLGALDTNLNALLKASSQKEFDEQLKGLMAVGGMLRSLQELQKQHSK
jgi:hypothetical protein